MTHLERFDAWRYGVSISGMTYGRMLILALELGHSHEDILKVENEIRHWLAKNEDTGKANKRLWGKFLLNWLTPKSSRQTGRLEPSDFN